jgi:hypothetical protein
MDDGAGYYGTAAAAVGGVPVTTGATAGSLSLGDITVSGDISGAGPSVGAIPVTTGAVTAPAHLGDMLMSGDTAGAGVGDSQGADDGFLSWLLSLQN